VKHDQLKPEHSVKNWARALEERGTPVHFPEHLEPEDSPFSAPGSLEYEHLAYLLRAAEAEAQPVVRDLLYPEIVRVTCMPTYWPPAWTLAIIGETKFGYVLLMTEHDVSSPPGEILPESSNPLSIEHSDPNSIREKPVIHRRTELPTELAGRVCSVWQRVVSETRYAAEPLLGKCDGDTYHFAYWRHRKSLPMGGKTWSPPEESVPGHLVALAQLLRGVLGGHSRVELAHALRGEPLNSPASSEFFERIEAEVAWLKEYAT